MNRILIKNVTLNNEITDVMIEGTRFGTIAPGQDDNGCRVVDGRHCAILPPFYNTHTHAAMTLLRSYADDMELFRWLNEYIWPREAQLTPEDIYAGSRLAILEMIKTGTVFFNDMYWHQMETIRAAEEMGVRAAIGLLFLESEQTEELNRKNNQELLAHRHQFSDRIQLVLAPHAIYTVSEKALKRIADQAKAEDLPIHIHLSETAREVADCQSMHGMTPVAYLEQLGLLGTKTLLAHCVHLSGDDMKRIAETNSVIAHMPCSNMKLGSGTFHYHQAFEKHHCRVTLGTDGAASNNSLSMLEEMKFAALLAKNQTQNPTVARDNDIFDIATRHGAEAFAIDSGVIATGKLADCMLVNLDKSFMIGNYNLISNLVYSADSSCIDSLICNGRILMEKQQVPNEAEIIAAAKKCCRV